MLLVVTAGESSGVRHKSVGLCVFVIRTNIGLANAHSPSRCAIISSQSHVYRRVEYVGYSFCTDKHVIAPGGSKTICPRRWQFDSRRIYTSVRGRVRSPHMTKLQAASVPKAYSLEQLRALGWGR